MKIAILTLMTVFTQLAHALPKNITAECTTYPGKKKIVQIEAVDPKYHYGVIARGKNIQSPNETRIPLRVVVQDGVVLVSTDYNFSFDLKPLLPGNGHNFSFEVTDPTDYSKPLSIACELKLLK